MPLEVFNGKQHVQELFNLIDSNFTLNGKGKIELTGMT